MIVSWRDLECSPSCSPLCFFLSHPHPVAAYLEMPFLLPQIHVLETRHQYQNHLKYHNSRYLGTRAKPQIPTTKTIRLYQNPVTLPQKILRAALALGAPVFPQSSRAPKATQDSGQGTSRCFHSRASLG